MTLGEKLQSLRAEVGLSQEDLAERLDVSRQAVSKWELDKTVPDVKYIVALSDLFGVTTDYLLREDASAPKEQPTEQPLTGPLPSEPASVRPWHAAPTACRVLEIGNVLAVSLLVLYLPMYLFNVARPGLWPLTLAVITLPVMAVLARMLLADVEIPSRFLRRFRRDMGFSTSFWGFAIALLIGFGEVIDDLLVSQVEGAASIPLLLLLLTALLLPLWCIGWFLAGLVMKRRKP